MQLVRQWNNVARLVAAGDLPVLYERHVDDSLALQDYLRQARTLMDIGSGGGFPGLPLALANPSLKVTLVERNRTKSSFLCHVVMTLGLTNVEVIEGDVREVSSSLERVDVLTARAVATPAKVWSWCRELLTQDGFMLLQSTLPIKDQLADGVAVASRSKGIGWINVVRRA